MTKEDSTWIDLYNSLYFISSKSGEIEYLESSIFDLFEELDSALYNGFLNKNLDHYLSEGWINKTVRSTLIRFRDFVSSIEDELWNKSDFDTNADWELARNWATNLLKQLGEEKQTWSFSGEEIIFTDDKN